MPVLIPGNVSITMSGNQTMALNWGRISMEVVIEKKTLGNWHHVPCGWGIVATW